MKFDLKLGSVPILIDSGSSRLDTQKLELGLGSYNGLVLLLYWTSASLEK